MHDIVCPICGRRTALYPGTSMACPSCGMPIAAPAQSSVDDDSATRPSFPPDEPAPSAAKAIDDETTRPVTLAAAESPSAIGGTTSGTTSGAISSETSNSGLATDVTADYPQPETPDRTKTVGAQATPSTEPVSQPVQPADAPAQWPGVAIPTPSDAPAETPPPSSAPSAPPAPPKRHSGRTLSLILLILLLLALGAAGILYANGRLPFLNSAPTPTAAATATPEPTATAPTDLRTFTDGDHVFTIGYPTNWLLATSNQPDNSQRLVIFSNPPAMATLNVGTLASTDTPPQQVDNQTLTLLGQKSGIANRTGPTQVFLGGVSWTQEAGDVTVLQGGQPVAMHAQALAVIHGNHTVYILSVAPVATYTTVDPFFQQMLQSFAFQ